MFVHDLPCAVPRTDGSRLYTRLWLPLSRKQGFRLPAYTLSPIPTLATFSGSSDGRKGECASGDMAGADTKDSLATAPLSLRSLQAVAAPGVQALAQRLLFRALALAAHLPEHPITFQPDSGAAAGLV
jgi:hypothetical protein